MFAPLIMGVLAAYFIIGLLVMALTTALTGANAATGESRSGSRSAGESIAAVVFWPIAVVVSLIRWIARAGADHK